MIKLGVRLVFAILLSTLIIFLFRNILLDFFYPSDYQRTIGLNAIVLISAYWVISSIFIALFIPNSIIGWFSGIIQFSFGMASGHPILFGVSLIIFVFGFMLWLLAAIILRPYLVISTIIHTIRGVRAKSIVA